MDDVRNAVVVMSGGQDSSAVLALALAYGRNVFPFTVHHNSLANKRERFWLRKLLASYRGHKQVNRLMVGELNTPWLDSNPLYGFTVSELILAREAEIEKGQFNSKTDIGDNPKGWPGWVVPYRNLPFMGMAASYAVGVKAVEIWIGYEGEDDTCECADMRPGFVDAFTVAMQKSNNGWPSIRFVTPLRGLTKGETVTLGNIVGAKFELTWSCLNGFRFSCGECSACNSRIKGFTSAGKCDPIKYEKKDWAKLFGVPRKAGFKLSRNWPWDTWEGLE